MYHRIQDIRPVQRPRNTKRNASADHARKTILAALGSTLLFILLITLRMRLGIGRGFLR